MRTRVYTVIGWGERKSFTFESYEAATLFAQNKYGNFCDIIEEEIEVDSWVDL